MNEEEMKFNKRKRNLILTLMQDQFEETMYEEFMDRDFGSLDEMDAFVDEKLRALDEEMRLVKEYYKDKISC